MPEWDITPEEMAVALYSVYECDLCGELVDRLVDLEAEMLLVCQSCALRYMQIAQTANEISA